MHENMQLDTQKLQKEFLGRGPPDPSVNGEGIYPPHIPPP